MNETGISSQNSLARGYIRKFGENLPFHSLDSLPQRASRYVEALPSAISGSRGHDALFRVACALAQGFALQDAEAWPILLEYNARCLPPWSERELKHKLAEARKVQHHEPKGYLLDTSEEPKRPAPPRIIGRITLPGPKSEQSASSVPHDDEARRVASELVKLHNEGAITGPHDPEAGFYAAVIYSFGATYRGRNEP